MNYAVTIDIHGNIKAVETDKENTFDFAKEFIDCEWIEAVYPKRIFSDEYVLLIDEEGKLKEKCYINNTASNIYGSSCYMDYIVGNAVIVKNGNEDYEFLTKKEAEYIVDRLIG